MWTLSKIYPAPIVLFNEQTQRWLVGFDNFLWVHGLDGFYRLCITIGIVGAVLLCLKFVKPTCAAFRSKIGGKDRSKLQWKWDNARLVCVYLPVDSRIRQHRSWTFMLWERRCCNLMRTVYICEVGSSVGTDGRWDLNFIWRLNVHLFLCIVHEFVCTKSLGMNG